MQGLNTVVSRMLDIPIPLMIAFILFTLFGGAITFWLFLFIIAPIPRPSLPLEQKYRSIDQYGQTSSAKALPCWYRSYTARENQAPTKRNTGEVDTEVEKAEVYMSLVVPAYNEEERLEIMLTEAVEFLQDEYGGYRGKDKILLEHKNNTEQRPATRTGEKMNGHSKPTSASSPKPPTIESEGWEILIVSDGSTDKTEEVAFRFAKTLGSASTNIRVITLHENRGKGGAVTHGMRHVRGEYAVFADADGASKFSDLGKLVRECKKVEDEAMRGVAVGSRAHLVGSEAVVKRSFLRNLLMHSFHLLLRLLTPPATGAIHDTQCGFKLFSRASLPYIIPYMHSEGWIFDVEMLMLAESAGIPVVEVPIGWKEVKGSKLNVLWDSLGMAWGLAVLRLAWGIGVYRRS